MLNSGSTGFLEPLGGFCEDRLKTLKLPTFLREYDKVARQCAAEGVDHVR